MNYTEGELRRYSRDTLVEELDRPLGFETIGDYTEDPAPERERTGIRLIPEMLDLLTQLQRRGFDIWVMSTSNDWSATIFAAEIGIHPTRVVGIRVKVDDSFLGEEPLIPTPTGAGAAEALTLFVGRTPVLAIASTADTEILSYGHGARIALIDKPLAAEIATEWRRRGWFVQSAFSPIRAPQVLPRSAAAATAAPAP